MSAIHFILTGGTIDKSYDPVRETPTPNDKTVVPYYLERKVRPDIEMSFEEICLLDSNDITEDIRGRILNAVKDAPGRHVVIVHGTSAMTVTADYLHEHLGEGFDKTVVLVGSMIPLQEFAMSDAGFNLGYAVACVQNLPAGVYICMNGRSFRAGEVIKNIEKARFEGKD